MAYGIFCAMCLYFLLMMVDNVQMMLSLFKNMLFTLASSGNLSGTGFLFASAVVGFYRMNIFYTKNNGISKRNYLFFILNTYLKIAPIVAIVLFFGWFILPLLGSGPQWHLTESFFQNCSSQWWANVLLFNNLYPWFTQALNGCMYWN